MPTDYKDLISVVGRICGEVTRAAADVGGVGEARERIKEGERRERSGTR